MRAEYCYSVGNPKKAKSDQKCSRTRFLGCLQKCFESATRASGYIRIERRHACAHAVHAIAEDALATKWVRFKVVGGAILGVPSGAREMGKCGGAHGVWYLRGGVQVAKEDLGCSGRRRRDPHRANGSQRATRRHPRPDRESPRTERCDLHHGVVSHRKGTKIQVVKKCSKSGQKVRVSRTARKRRKN